jgi:excisionase family DNA binding protein
MGDKAADFMSVREVAQMFKCSKRHVVNMIEAEVIEAINISIGIRSTWRVKKASITKLLEEKKRNSLKNNV